MIADGNGGTTSGSITFTIENLGSADLSISSVSIGGTNSSDFDLTDNTSSPISGPSGTTSFSTRFDPLTTGSKTAIITVICNDSDEGTYTFTVNGEGVVLVPAAPSNLTTTQFSDSTLGIQWDDNSKNEDLFRIDRKIEEGSFLESATVGSNIASFNDSTIEQWYRYTYRIRAYNTYGNSDYSNEISSLAVNQNRITPPSGSNTTSFGTSISVSQDGAVVVVGDPAYSDNKDESLYIKRVIIPGIVK